MNLGISNLDFFKQLVDNIKLKSILDNNPLFAKLINNISNYFSIEYGKSIDYNPIKSKEQFLNNYNLHDIALNYVIGQFKDKGFIICTLGKDLRKLKVEMKNEIPDLLILNENKIISLDIKAKRSIKWFGRINKRAVCGYRRFRDSVSISEYTIPIYAQFILIEENKSTGVIGYSNLSEIHLKENIEWDKNITYQFNWKKGLVGIEDP